METNVSDDLNSGGIIVRTGITHSEISNLSARTMPLIIDKIVENVAKEYLDKNLIDIMKKINPLAIANMSIAQSASELKNRIAKKEK